MPYRLQGKRRHDDGDVTEHQQQEQSEGRPQPQQPQQPQQPKAKKAKKEKKVKKAAPKAKATPKKKKDEARNDEKDEEKDEEMCAICFDSFGASTRVYRLSTCHHFFCKDCYVEAAVNGITSCPCCRGPLRGVDVCGPTPPKAAITLVDLYVSLPSGDQVKVGKKLQNLLRRFPLQPRISAYARQKYGDRSQTILGNLRQLGLDIPETPTKKTYEQLEMENKQLRNAIRIADAQVLEPSYEPHYEDDEGDDEVIQDVKRALTSIFGIALGVEQGDPNAVRHQLFTSLRQRRQDQKKAQINRYIRARRTKNGVMTPALASDLWEKYYLK